MIVGNLSLEWDTFTLKSGDFRIPGEGITVLFGKSGAGKSTFLRALAGLEPRVRGTLLFKGQEWLKGSKSLPSEKRNIGFVFQDAALFPHLNVRENLNYAMRRAPEKRADALGEVAEKMGILGKLEQNVQSLSGGEKQRVAIARALLSQPKLLCMDEPISSLDWEAKEDILTLIERIVNDSRLPILYITHSPNEAMRLASHVMLMTEGRIEKIEKLNLTRKSNYESLFRLPFANETYTTLATHAKHPNGERAGAQPSSRDRCSCSCHHR